MSVVTVTDAHPYSITVQKNTNTVSVQKKTTTVTVSQGASTAQVSQDLAEHIANTQLHRKLSNLTITRNGFGFITRLDWANGDYEIFNRDGNNFITSIVGNVWTKTFTRDGNNRVTAITWAAT